MSDEGFNNDVNEDSYDSTELTVNNTVSQIATTGTVDYRQWVRIYNSGPGKLLFGPVGKPKEVLFKLQGVTLNHSVELAVEIIAVSSTCTVVVTESG